jgi:hypothetical protein
MLFTGAATASASVSHSTVSHNTKSAALRAFKKYLKENDPVMMKAKLKGSNSTQFGSYNWSGYAETSATAQTFDQVSGSWKVPKVTCTKEDEIFSSWVGLDGETDGTVEQTGTSSQCFEGAALYYSWYEMYPAGTAVVGTTVRASDAIAASVSRSGTSYTLILTDSTTSGNNISATASCGASTCLDESAEWIAERPEYSTTGIVPLADYKTWTLKNATVNSTFNISSYSASNDQIFMLDSTDTYYLSEPSALTGGGTGFKTTWKNSY